MKRHSWTQHDEGADGIVSVCKDCGLKREQRQGWRDALYYNDDMTVMRDTAGECHPGEFQNDVTGEAG